MARPGIQWQKAPGLLDRETVDFLEHLFDSFKREMNQRLRR